MTPFEFGHVVLVPFPFTDQTAAKRRPAVVVSSRAYAQARADLMLMAITSQIRPMRGLGEVWVRHWQAAGLLKPSAIKPVIATLEQRLVVKSLGVLQSDDQESLRAVIGRIIG